MIPMLLAALFTTTTAVSAPVFPVEMELEYCYEGSPCAYAEWTFYADGTLEDNLGGEAEWRVTRGELRLIYEHGSEYRGTLDSRTRCINGVNLHADGRRGEFTACM